MTRRLDYGSLMHRAMRRLIREVLEDVAEHGLPGEHHFFITFETMHPDVEIGDWLSDRYPEEMTVVLQHWYDHLDVTPEGFSVTLNFGDAPEALYIPYDAIRTFVDPSVEFGLRFEAAEDGAGKPLPDENEGEGEAATPLPAVAAPAKDEEEADDKRDAEVVSLDAFRKT
jgi:hypothetical protein